MSLSEFLLFFNVFSRTKEDWGVEEGEETAEEVKGERDASA